MSRGRRIPSTQRSAVCEDQWPPGKGYFIDDLIYSIEELLGLNKVNEAIVIGAGRLGQAISLYPGFDRYGLRIVALFDNDPFKIGQKVGNKPILNVAKMPELIRRMAIPMAVITVPAEHAQAVADQAILGGVRALWNFAPVVLKCHLASMCVTRILPLGWHLYPITWPRPRSEESKTTPAHCGSWPFFGHVKVTDPCHRLKRPYPHRKDL